MVPEGFNTALGKVVSPNVFADAGRTAVRQLGDLTASRLNANAANKLIQALLRHGISQDSDTGPKKNFSSGTVKPESEKSMALNSAMGVLAMLHSRIEFLIAVRSLSDEVYNLIQDYRPITEQLPTEERALLSDYELIRTPRVKRLLHLLVGAVTFGRRQYDKKAEEAKKEAEPKFQEYLTGRQEKNQQKLKNQDQAKDLKLSVFNDEDI